MAILLAAGMLPGVIWVESEFDGQFATCGPNSLAMAESYGLQRYIGVPVAGQTATTVIYNRMRAAGRADPSGASNMGGLQAQANADGFKTARHDGSAGWKDWTIARLNEGATVIMEPSRGQVLRDLVTGQGMDATNLQYHFNLIVGYKAGPDAAQNWPEGYWMADGDNGATNPVINGVRTRVRGGHNLQYYTIANVMQSAPIAFLAVYPKVSIQPPAPPAPPAAHPNQPAGFPAGWSDDGKTLSYGGVPVVRGFRDYLLAHPELVSGPHFSDNTPIEAERSVAQVEAWNTQHGPGSVQTFHRMRLAWTARDGVYVMWLGDEARYLERQKVGAM